MRHYKRIHPDAFRPKIAMCPKCGAILKKFKRQNHPFGIKSKGIQIHGFRCFKCGFTVINETNQTTLR